METQELKSITRKIKSRLTKSHLEKLLRDIPERYEQKVVLNDIPDRVRFLSIEDKEGKNDSGKLILNLEVTDWKSRNFHKDIRIYYRRCTPSTMDCWQIESYGWITEDRFGEFLDKVLTFYVLFTESLVLKIKLQSLSSYKCAYEHIS